MNKTIGVMKEYVSVNEGIRCMMICVLCVCFPSIVFSANKINSVKSFIVTVPDTIVQGNNFCVEYELEATHWKNTHVKKGAGMTLTDNIIPNIVKGHPYQKLNLKAKFITSQVGQIKLPPMVVEIDGHEVMSETKEVYVKPHPQYGEEMTIAHEWLIKKGVNKDLLSLNYTAIIGNLFFFCDQQHECFCLVAKKDTWEYAGNPVWAYSTECAMDEKALKDFMPYFFEYYSELLGNIKNTGQKVQESAKDLETIAPLLGELRWGQNAPYNSKLPTKDKKRVVVGCVPLAMSMIMKYYEWPKQGSSMVKFEVEKRRFEFDCSEIKPQWEKYKNKYDEKEVEECSELSKLLGTLGLMMSPKYEESETGANMYSIKRIMCNNLGYSGRLTVKAEPSNPEVNEIIKNEIRNHRPCIVSRNSHAFICDGYEDGLFHYNMGWKGLGNGYYRIPTSNMRNDSTFFRTIVMGIEPQKSEKKKEITLKQAGTLAEMLSDEEKETITFLTISGPINSSDIRLIRAMAGAKGDSLYDNRDMCTLRTLDLTGATITADKTSYRTRKATNSYTGSRTTNTIRRKSDGTGILSSDSFSATETFKFDFNKMDETQWKLFKYNYARLAKKNGLMYERISDTEYIESSFCIKNTVGEQMFAGCSSLCNIILPQNTKAVLDYAFAACTSLQNIQMPPKVKRGKNIFFDCPALIKTPYKK